MMEEPIVLDSDSDDNDVALDALAEDRPPSDDDYASSITISSSEDEDEDYEGDDVEEGDQQNGQQLGEGVLSCFEKGIKRIFWFLSYNTGISTSDIQGARQI